MRLPVRSWAATLASLGFSKRNRAAQNKRAPGRRSLFESLEPRQMLTTYYWDAAAAGSSNWSSENPVWSASPSGGSDVAWDSTHANDTAVFQSRPGDITVAENISVGNIQFEADGFRLIGSGIVTLTGDGSGNGAIDVATDAAATVNVQLTGSGGLNKTGGGTLELGEQDTYTGATNIAAGTLELGNVHAIYFSSTLSSASGGTLDLNGQSITSAVPPFDNFAGTIVNASSANQTAAFNGPINANTQTNFAIGGEGTTVLGGAITTSSGMSVSHNGDGTAVLSGSLALNGGSIVNNSGALQIDSASLDDGSLNTAGGSIVNVLGSLEIDAGATGGPAQLSQTSLDVEGGTARIVGGAELNSVTIGADATLTLGGIQTYDGPQVLYWDPHVTGSAAGGSGTWQAGVDQWWNGVADVAWSDGAIADFDGAAGTVAVAGTINAGQVDFLSDGYIVNESTDGGALSVSTGSISVPTGDLATLNAPLVGDNPLDKIGNGTLLVGGVNTYTGITLATAGILKLGSPTALGDTQYVMGRGTIGSLQGGTLDLNGQDLTSAPPLNIFLATLKNSSSTPATFDGDVNTSAVPHPMPLYVGGSGDINFAGTIYGDQAVYKSGGGNLIFTSSQPYTGKTFVSGGTLQIGDGTGHDITLASDIQDNATVIFAPTTAESYSGTISGSGALHINGSGSLTLSGQNTFSGGTLSSGASLIIAGDPTVTDGALVSSPIGVGTFTINSGSISDDGSPRAIANSVSVSSGASITLVTTTDGALSFDPSGETTPATMTLAGATTITATGAVTIADPMSGAGSLTATGDGQLILAAADSYSGSTTIDDSATLEFGDGYGDDGSATGAIDNSGSLIFQNSGPITMPGVISGDGTIEAAGSGELTLSGDNTYTGPLSVTGFGQVNVTGSASGGGTVDVSTGVFTVGSGGSLGDSAVTVSTDAELDAHTGGNAGIGASGATIALQSQSTLDMVDGAIGTLTIDSASAPTTPAVTLDAVTLNLEVSSAGADEIAINGAASISGTNTINLTGLGTSLTPSAEYTLIGASSGLTGTFEFANGSQTESLQVGADVYTLELANSGTAETLTVVGTPTYAVYEGGNVVDGSTTLDLGQAHVNEPTDASFVITNQSSSTLTLSDPISLPTGFTLASDFTTHTLAPGASTYFTIRLDSQTAGTFSGNLSFGTSDGDRPTFTLPITDEITDRTIGVNDPGAGVVGADWASVTDSSAADGAEQVAPAGTGEDSVSWVFPDLNPGIQYEVDATWTARDGQATNATYTILDGSYTQGATDPSADYLDPPSVVGTLGTVAADQTASPTGTTVGAVTWQQLGVFTATSGIIEVDLNNDANGSVVADGLRVVAVHTPEAPVLQALDPQTKTVGDTLSVQATAIVPDSSATIAYSIANAPPPGMAINTSTGVLTWDTTSAPPGTYQISVEATDNVTGLIGSKVFSLTLNPASGGGSDTGGYCSEGGPDGDLPTVSVYTDADAIEGGTPGFIRIFRTGDLSADLPVTYTIDESTTGSAQYGSEYIGPDVSAPDNGILTGSVLIPAGSATVDIPINAGGDTDNANNPTVNFTLTENDSGGSPTYTVGATPSAAPAITTDLALKQGSTTIGFNELAIDKRVIYAVQTQKAPADSKITYTITAAWGLDATGHAQDSTGAMELFTIDSNTGYIYLNNDASTAHYNKYVITVVGQGTLPIGETNKSSVFIDVTVVPTVGIYGHNIAVRGSNTDFIELTFQRFVPDDSQSLTAYFTVDFHPLDGTQNSIEPFDIVDGAGKTRFFYTQSVTFGPGQTEAHIDLYAAAEDSDTVIAGIRSATIEVIAPTDNSYAPVFVYSQLFDTDDTEIVSKMPLYVLDALTAFAASNPKPTLTDSSATGVDQNDVFQGQIGDCYFMAAMIAVARANPSQITSLITDNGDGTFNVKLVGQASDPINDSFFNGVSMAQLSGDIQDDKAEIWPQLLEKAWADKNRGYRGIDNTFDAVNSVDDAIHVLTGKQTKGDDPANLSAAAFGDLLKKANSGTQLILSTVLSQGERIKTCTDYQAVHYSGQAGQRRMDLGGGEALPPDGSSPLRHGGWSWLWRRRRLFGTSVAFRIRAARVVGCITCAI